MKTSVNQFGDTVTKWTSHQHPENANFMQLVYWIIYEKDCKVTVRYHLGDIKDSHSIYGMSKAEVIEKFTDAAEIEINEANFQDWLKNRQ